MARLNKSIRHPKYADCSMDYICKDGNEYVFADLTYGVVEYTVLQGIEIPKSGLIGVTWEGLVIMLLGIEWEMHRNDFINYLYKKNILSDDVIISTYAKPLVGVSYVTYKIPDSKYYVRIRRSGRAIYDIIHNCFLDLKLYGKRIKFIAYSPFESTTKLKIRYNQDKVEETVINSDEYISDEQILKIFDIAEYEDVIGKISCEDIEVDSYNNIDIINTIRFSCVEYNIFSYSIYLGKLNGDLDKLLELALAGFIKRTKLAGEVINSLMELDMREEWGVYLKYDEGSSKGLNADGIPYKFVYDRGNEYGVRKFITENRSSWLFSGLSFIELMKGDTTCII